MGFLSGFFGENDFKPILKKINELENEIAGLTIAELRERAGIAREEVRGGKGSDEVLPVVFALTREVAKRTIGQRAFDTQLTGAMALHRGKIAEMRTGEGKTLAAVFAVYLNSLSGEGVHVITVNDYLARRDAVWMGQIYHALGASVGCLTHDSAYVYDPSYKLADEPGEFRKADEKRDEIGNFLVMQDFLRPVSRKEAYSADITYGTNHEFGFDYLRDNLAYRKEDQVQRSHHYAVIDEVDSILIDESRTPLIIAAPDNESSEYYKVFTKAVSGLAKEEDYEVDEKLKTVDITDKGIDKIEKFLNIKNIYSPENIRMVRYLEESLKAMALFHRDKQYVVNNGEVIIVDEFTGRMLHGRRYSGGLHQAIEAREGVDIKQETRVYAQITIQNYFRLYSKISGMTGTAQTSAEELHKVYNLEVVTIPTNKPSQRKDSPDQIYKTREAKYKAAVEAIREKNAKGQPVLIGTASIQNNELLSDLLRQAGIAHEVLNAKNHEREGAIIAQAGRLGAVTVATNMAGRGVDIILGGNPTDPEEAKEILKLGGLFVLGTERHEARRIDNQLRGRSGRQGDPGATQFFLSLEDDLMRIFGGDRIKRLMETFNFPENQPLESKMISNILNEAQKKVEGLNFDSRKHLLDYDDVLQKQRLSFYKKRQEMLDSGVIPPMLSMFDLLWMDHLEGIEALRDAVGMRAYGQHDPLVEYRRESYLMFQEMLNQFEKWMEENKDKIEEFIKNQSAEEQQILSRANIPVPENKDSKFDNVGRNDPCPCGAKKEDGTSVKFKHCHGK